MVGTCRAKIDCAEDDELAQAPMTQLRNENVEQKLPRNVGKLTGNLICELKRYGTQASSDGEDGAQIWVSRKMKDER